MDTSDEGYEYKLRKLAHWKRLEKAQSTEMMMIIIIAFMVGILFVGVLIAFFILVYTKFTFSIYYPQISTDHPGSGVNQQTNVFRFVLRFGLFRIPFVLLFIWLVKRMGTSWKMTLFSFIFVVLILLEGVSLGISFVGWLFCNNYYWPTNACNDPNYGKAYGNIYPEIFPPGTYTGLSPDSLTPYGPYVDNLLFILGFIFLEVVMFAQIPAMVEVKNMGKRM